MSPVHIRLKSIGSPDDIRWWCVPWRLRVPGRKGRFVDPAVDVVGTFTACFRVLHEILQQRGDVPWEISSAAWGVVLDNGTMPGGKWTPEIMAEALTKVHSGVSACRELSEYGPLPQFEVVLT